MKKFFYFFLIFVSAIFLVSFFEVKTEKYRVEILQDNKIIPIVNNVVTLEKREFQIRVILNNHDGVFMSASFDRDYYDLKDGDEIKDYKWLNCKSRAENSFNIDKELVIHKEYVSYLFYDKNLDWHRFDSTVIINGNTIIGTKTVQKLYDENSNQEISLNNVTKNIYLFFLATENWEDDVIPKELGRTKIEIRW